MNLVLARVMNNPARETLLTLLTDVECRIGALEEVRAYLKYSLAALEPGGNGSDALPPKRPPLRQALQEAPSTGEEPPVAEAGEPPAASAVLPPPESVVKTSPPAVLTTASEPEKKLAPPPVHRPSLPIAPRASGERAYFGKDPTVPEGSNLNATATSDEGIRIGRSIVDPFTATDLRARLDGPQQRVYNWIAAWKRKQWIETVGFGQYVRTSQFGK